VARNTEWYQEICLRMSEILTEQISAYEES